MDKNDISIKEKWEVVMYTRHVKRRKKKKEREYNYKIMIKERE